MISMYEREVTSSMYENGEKLFLYLKKQNGTTFIETLSPEIQQA